ncbi:hypothetical protein FR943_09390 [Mycobacterium sp. TNTM28]|uniref:Alanine, arginine and proline rich protein n=1 Tax=[Mycobacterium] fortunisiensis TaxID=2600579 RepID=A0ABS6KKD1_9MYCO|nr:Rv3235 family protein [[Mycobacterium] fortunisiensis]MBU9764055.1 hypothetical protein [[Mycobacterium] fortunisiensis]
MPTPETIPTLLPLTAPVIDCEPPAVTLGAIAAPSAAELPAGPTCPAPTVLHRPTPHRSRPAGQVPDPELPAGAAQFADVALRRVLEVVDRRRPPAQLKPLMSHLLLDAVVSAATAHRQPTPTRLRRVGLRRAAQSEAAEVFATYTCGVRVRAIAARIELRSGRWQFTALQVG